MIQNFQFKIVRLKFQIYISNEKTTRFSVTYYFFSMQFNYNVDSGRNE